jgi:hypothetical protein
MCSDVEEGVMAITTFAAFPRQSERTAQSTETQTRSVNLEGKSCGHGSGNRQRDH